MFVLSLQSNRGVAAGLWAGPDMGLGADVACRCVRCCGHTIVRRPQVAVLKESAVPKWDRETARLNYSPVSMRELERVGLNAVSLGIMENEADLDTIKNYTAGVFVVFSIAAIAFGELGAQLFPGKNVGPTITYVLGVFVCVFLREFCFPPTV